VNDFSDNIELAIFEDFARCIREIDRRARHHSKPELFRQAHRGIATEMIHPPGALSRQYRSDSVTPPVAGRQPSRRVCAGSLLRAVVRWNKVRAHIIVVILSEANRASILCKILSQGHCHSRTGIGCFALPQHDTN